METHIKRGIKFVVYIAAATIGFALVVLGFQHKTGKSATDSSSLFAPQVFADAPGGDDDDDGNDDGDAPDEGNDGNDDGSANGDADDDDG